MTQIDDKLFKDSLNTVAHTEEGKIVLSYLKDALGWDDIFMSLEDSNHANVYYQTRRAVYGWLRGMINKDDLKKIEFNYERKAATNDGTNTKRTRGATNITGKRTGNT